MTDLAPWGNLPPIAEWVTDLDPVSVMRGMDRNGAELDAAGRALGALLDRLGEAEIAYGDLLDDAVAQLVEDFDGKRLPGEDVRRALAHKQPAIREAWHTLRRLERRKDALEAWGRKVEHAMSGRQSIAKLLSAEQNAPGSRIDGQTFGSRRAA